MSSLGLSTADELLILARSILKDHTFNDLKLVMKCVEKVAKKLGITDFQVIDGLMVQTPEQTQTEIPKEIAILYNSSDIVGIDKNGNKWIKFVQMPIDEDIALRYKGKKGVLVAGPKNLKEKIHMVQAVDNRWRQEMKEVLDEDMIESIQFVYEVVDQ